MTSVSVDYSHDTVGVFSHDGIWRYLPMESRPKDITIEPNETLGHALKDKSLWVPANQRNYAWKEKHVTDLFSDLTLAISKNVHEYFLGSIVVIGTKEGRSMVVDGQQRLATTLILLAAIRDFLEDNNDAISAGKLQRAYILSEEFGSSEPTPHLRLNEIDHDYFHKRVLLPKSDPRRQEVVKNQKNLKPSHANINKAVMLAAAKVKNIVKDIRPEDQFEVLRTWVNFLEKGARVIWVSVPDESSAYTIFETMNDRGLALSATDLIKNHLLGRAGEDRINQVKHNWIQMTGTLETVRESEITKSFIRHYWVSRYGRVRGQELFAAIKEQFRNSSDVVQFSHALADEAVNYAALLTPSHTLWAKYGDQARGSLFTLNLLGIEQIRPLLLIALDKLDAKEMSKLLTVAVSWAVRLLIAGKQGSGALEQLYGQAAEKTAGGEMKTAASISKFMSREVPGDEKFESDFSLARVSRAALARYYLRALERQHRNEKEPYLIPNDELVINLEHVMPETPSHDWSHIPQEVFDSYVTRIGNQVLLQASQNSALGNKGFSKKKQTLLDADFETTKWAGQYKSWGAREIEDRQKRLARLAALTWSLKIN
jgi:uncharacterized protein DUF262/uncharacterized protein DUF1524